MSAPIAGYKHKQSSRTGFYFDGERLGFHCFAAGCEGNSMSIGAVIKFLNSRPVDGPGIRVRTPYDGPIWTEDERVTDLEGPDGYNLTALGNMERLLAKHGDSLRWTGGTFYKWTGQRWEVDDVEPGRLAQQIVRDLGELVEKAAKVRGAAMTDKVTRCWRQSERGSMVQDMISLIKPRIVIDRGQFDADPMLFATQNGVLDLRDGSFLESRKEDYISKQANVVFDAFANCPTWCRFLLETCSGDEGLSRYLQQCAGICLTGLTEEHLFFIVLGPAGTGKTTFQETLKFVWGNYCVGVDPNSLAAGKADAGRARPDLAKLPGVRLAFANESRQGLRIDEGLLKSLVGGDTITARQLYQAEFDFVPQYKLWLRTNQGRYLTARIQACAEACGSCPSFRSSQPKIPNCPRSLGLRLPAF